MSKDHLFYLRKFDMAGIALMILGAATPPFYYGFMCASQSVYQKVHLGITWISCLIALCVAMHPTQRDLKNTQVLALSFVTAGLSTLPGAIHLGFFMEARFVRDFPVWIFLLAGGFGIGGAVLYAIKWPERRFPGRFDCFGNSHNIFHFCVVIGQILTWWGSIRVFHERQLYACPA